MQVTTDMLVAVRAVVRHLPTVLTFLALAGLFWWGHRTGWKLSRPAAEASHLATDHWCPEHHVTEDVCLLCRKALGRAQAAQEPERQRAPGEDIRFAQVASPEALAKADIRVEPVTIATITPQLRLAGETRYPPTAVARLGSPAPGVVRQVLVDLGAVVTAGEVVAVVDANEVGRAKSALLQALSARELAEGNVQRARVTAAAGVRTAADLQEFEVRARAAEITVFDAEQVLRNFGLTIDISSLADLDPAQLSERLRRLGLPANVADGGSANVIPIIAQRAGTVTGIHAVAGEAIAANTAIVVIADASQLWLALPVGADRAERIAVGQAVSFQSDSGSAATGSVVVIGQDVDPQTRLVPVWASLDNAAGHLRSGQFGTALVTTGAAITGATVPTGALQFDGDQAYVFVRRSPTIFRSLSVRILARASDRIAVDRLAEGDEIAVSGTGVLFSVTFPERLGAGCTDH